MPWFSPSARLPTVRGTSRHSSVTCRYIGKRPERNLLPSGLRACCRYRWLDLLQSRSCLKTVLRIHLEKQAVAFGCPVRIADDDQLIAESASATMRVRVPDVHHQQIRSEEHTSELQSLMRISYAVF